MVELVDTLVSGTSASRHGGSSPPQGKFYDGRGKGMYAGNLTEKIIIIRLLLSFLAGCCIGMERSGKRQVAGLRTHILICMGACGMMIISLWLSQIYKDADPGRVAAQVVSGMGFLGAGAILKIGANVKGLTTAASIWVIAGIGLALGSGLYIMGAVMTGLSLLTLSVMNRIELMIFPLRQNKFLEIYFRGMVPPVNEISNILSEYAVSIISTNIRTSKSKKEPSKILLFINTPKRLDIKHLTEDLEKIETVDTFLLKEKA